MWKRSVLPVFLLIIPLALILGYLLATPDDLMSFGYVGLLLFTLSIPILLRWHHLFLICSWNALLVPFFIPGHPDMWILLALVSLTIAILHRAIDKQKAFLKAPEVATPLLFLALVVLVTAKLTGGIGLSAIGSQTYGGKKYIYFFAGVIGYFALTSQEIPKHRAKLYAALFFLPGLTALISNLAYMAGPSFYFLFALFPVDSAVTQATAEQSVGNTVVRVSGLALACLAIYSVLLAHNGIRELFNIRKPWKIVLLVAAVLASLLAGFRSTFILFGLMFVCLFFLEGLHRTRFLLGIIIGTALVAALFLPFLPKLPFSVQRALSFLPIHVDPIARADAEGSTQWRIEMWKIVAPQIPQYFWKGKGYAIDPTDLYLTEQQARYGMGGTADVAMLAGDYHSGPLSLIIPFGIFGVIGFVWFLIGGLRVLYCNNRFGDPELRNINRFLFAYFLIKSVFFFTIFGSLHSDMFGFVGLVGLSISLNGGVCRQVLTRTALKPASPVQLAPA